jgi:hypothetical protein
LFSTPQAKWKILDRVLFQKILHKKKFIGTDKISEIVNDSDSDDGSFSELSNSETYEANSPLAAVTAKRQRKKLCSASQTEGGRKHAGPFLNAQIQIWS